MSADTISRARPRDAPPGHGPRDVAAALNRTLDDATDVLVALFAVWTVLYHVGLTFRSRTNPLLELSAVSLPLLIWLLVIRPGDGAASESAGGRIAHRAALVSFGLAVGSAALVAFGGTGLWWPGWAAGALAALLGLMAALPGRRAGRARLSAAPMARLSQTGTYLAAATATGLGVLSMFLRSLSADDAYYVNRAAWTADHGSIATADTMFTNQRIPAIRGAGVPVSSIETLQGAIAHAFHVPGGTIAYIFTPPIAIFLAVWALWRLIRNWAPRRLPLCFAIAVGYLLYSTHGKANLGTFFLSRIQEGKVVFVAALVPLMYFYLTRWAERQNLRSGSMLFICGIAAVGLTSSATFIVPLICGCAAIPLLLIGRARAAAGTLLAAAYPLGTGLVVHFAAAPIADGGRAYSARFTMHYVLGSSTMCLVGWLAVLSGVWFVRAGLPKMISAGIPLVVVLILAPGVLDLMNTFTGAHAVLWRTMWVAPVPALVGVVASVRLPSGWRWAAPVPAVGLGVALILSGTPFWAPAHHLVVASGPTWRVAPDDLTRARQILHRDPSGPVLAPLRTMMTLAILTTRVHPVSARDLYNAALEEPAAQRDARALLTTVIAGQEIHPSEIALRAALDSLGVTLVCGLTQQTHREKLFGLTGFEATSGLSGAWCLKHPPPPPTGG